MEFVLSDACSLPRLLYEALGQYRYRVFIEKLGWQLDTPPGVERDQFDLPDTVHVIVRDKRHGIVGCARLLPTSGPYLLGEVFPQLMNGQPPRVRRTYGNCRASPRWTCRPSAAASRRSSLPPWPWKSCNWLPTMSKPGEQSG